jgi:hypothetical protein
MLGKLPGDQQCDLFRPLLIDFMDMNHELVQLAHAINWQGLGNRNCRFSIPGKVNPRFQYAG